MKPKPKTTANLPQSSQLFSEHLDELRARGLWCLVSLAVGTIIGYFLHNQLFEVLMRPLHQPIYYTSPAGGLDFVLKTSFLFGVLVSLPVFTYQVVRFVEPVLPRKAPRLIASSLFASTFLLLLGMSFAYLVSLPAALYFLSSFTSENVHALISTTEYFSFVGYYLLGFAVIFQLPLVLFLINIFQPIPTKALWKHQRWVILASFIIAAVLTPTPDVVNQLIMALPLIALYEFTVVLLWMSKKNLPVTISKP